AVAARMVAVVGGGSGLRAGAARYLKSCFSGSGGFSTIGCVSGIRGGGGGGGGGGGPRWIGGGGVACRTGEASVAASADAGSPAASGSRSGSGSGFGFGSARIVN